jgi:hemolysin III
MSFLVFGVSLASCYLGSAMFHGVHASDKAGLDVFDRLDHIGIFMLIAGSYTPIAWNMLQPRWRFSVLVSAWGMAAVGSLLCLSVGVLPPMVGTSIYLAMGWGAIFCYLELSRFISHKRLFPLILGGVFYSVGAVINLLKWPVLMPGTFESHELFHVLVMAGSLTHYLFMLKVVLPGRPATATVMEPSPPKKPILVKAARPSQSWLVRVSHVRIGSHLHPGGR